VPGCGDRDEGNSSSRTRLHVCRSKIPRVWVVMVVKPREAKLGRGSQRFRDMLGPLGPPPEASSPSVSHSMKSNRPRDTLPEIILRRALRGNGITGYQTGWDGAPGRPDVAFPSLKVAVFVHGCYWHRCPTCQLPLPKSHREFWRRKFERNEARDKRKLAALHELGWDALVVWECELHNSPGRVAQRISKHLDAARRPHGRERKTA
jgi:DNA mismatch endonuclease (patch repair protein)